MLQFVCLARGTSFDYNKLFECATGLQPGSARDKTKFDPGAKNHVATNVPYMRYFLAAILQFQVRVRSLREHQPVFH